MTQKYEKKRIKRTWGRDLIFDGRLLCEREVDSRNFVRAEIWETKAGNLVPVLTIEGSSQYVKADVVPGNADNPPIDAVMDVLEWRSVARSMVKVELGWQLKQEIE